MSTRRLAVKLALASGAVALLLFSNLGNGLNKVLAQVKRRIVGKGTPVSDLMVANPAKLDTSLLETTPMGAFDVMGQTVYPVDLANWRLEVGGSVRRPVSFTYDELIARPVLERNVLLICYGFFAYNGLWKGFSVAELLKEVGLLPGVSHVKFSGPEGLRRKTRKFAIAEVASDKIFIAYGVNDERLPERHGFPMRLVAEDHKGERWVKYVNRLTVIGG